MLQVSADAERTRQIADRAFALMTRYEIAPLPLYYEIWFAYAGNFKPELTRALEAWMRSQTSFTDHFANELYERHLTPGPTTEAVEDIGKRMQSELDQLGRAIQTAGRDASAYGNTLQGAAGLLGKDVNLTGLRGIVDNLVIATRHMQRRSKELEQQLEQSNRETQSLRQNIEQVRKASLTDALTGLANRKYFDERLAEALRESRRSDEPLSLLLADIDHFKKFNDSWGHQTGDQVLRLVARSLSDNVKGRDTPVRYGGEEFAVILPNTSLDNAVRLADQIRKAVEGKSVVRRSTGEKLATITVSFGAALYRPEDTAESLIARADQCLYAAKHAGRNCVRAESDADALAALTAAPPPEPKQAAAPAKQARSAAR
jgi:diguanylate cyclase